MIGNNSKYSVETTFSLEDYFPVKVGLNNYIDNIRYIQYEKDNFNMLEVTANKTSNEFYRLQLVISNSFSITDESISLIENYEEGIAVFGSTDPTATGPISAKWQCISNRSKCSPCFEHVCPLGHKECMKQVGVEFIIEQLQKKGF